MLQIAGGREERIDGKRWREREKETEGEIYKENSEKSRERERAPKQKGVKLII